MYRFDEFRLDAGERQLFKGSQEILLTAKAFDVLLVLVRNRSKTVTKEEFMQFVWPDAVVEESNLADNVSTLRQLLGDDARDPRYIRTIPRRGYRFVAEVERMVSAPSSTPVSTNEGELSTLQPSVHRTRRKDILLGAMGILTAIVLAVLLIAGRNGEEQPATHVPATESAVRSIAVLPFAALVEAQRDEPLELGMTDAIISRLSTIREVRTLPSASVFSLSEERDFRKIGKALDVDVLLDGRVQKQSGRVRVSVQLIRASDGSLLWADRFDESLQDLFRVQDVIAERVANKLALRLASSPSQSLAPGGTRNIDAYQHYIQGRFFWNKRTPIGFERAIDHFEKAIALDPEYAQAHASLAETYVVLPGWTQAPAHEMAAKAEKSARRAIELDPRVAEAYTALGSAWDHQNKFAASGEAFRRAIELNPNYPTAHQWYAEWLIKQNRLREAGEHVEIAHRLDPLSLAISVTVGFHHYLNGRLDLAEEQMARTLELDPSMIRPHVFLSWIHFDRGDLRRAASARARIIVANRAETPGRDSDREDVEKALLAAIQRDGRDGYLREQMVQLERLGASMKTAPAIYVENCALLGNLDCAFEALRIAIDINHPIVSSINVDPHLANLRRDPRYPALAREIGIRID